MSQHQQNWNRINSELRKAIDQLDGPIEDHGWSEYRDDTKNVFETQIESILDAEVSHRFGDESRVNIRIREALEAIGEQLARDTATTGQKASDV